MSENKNIMILFLSIVHNTEQSYKYIYETQFHIPEIVGVQTNEAAVKAILHQLHKKDETLSKIYMLCTNTVLKATVALKGKTHSEFYETRIKEFCEEYEYSLPEFEPIDYDEKSTGDKVFEPIIEMANRIYRDYSSSNITVYVDMTGGMRNSSMLMLSIMRMLEYNEKKVEKVLYSNKPSDYNTVGAIDDSTDIYKINNLIAGAEEFVKFGSAKILTDYFEDYMTNCKSSILSALIKAMNSFSENLKLCRSGYFDNAIRDLKCCIKNYNKANEEGNLNNINEKVFALFMSKIEQQYNSLLEDSRTDLDIISWCIKNKYIQQALTLYVEKIPDYIVKNRILYYSNNPNIKSSHYFLMDYFFYNYEMKRLYDNPIKKAAYVIQQLDVDNTIFTILDTTDNNLNKILKDYYEINNIRNKVSHANNKIDLDIHSYIKKLTDLLNDSINHLKSNSK